MYSQVGIQGVQLSLFIPQHSLSLSIMEEEVPIVRAAQTHRQSQSQRAYGLNRHDCVGQVGGDGREEEETHSCCKEVRHSEGKAEFPKLLILEASFFLD